MAPVQNPSCHAEFAVSIDICVAQANEVINHPDVQAVWVCSPSQFHADQIKTSAKAGKHIFCEKPIATDLAGTIEAVQVRKLNLKEAVHSFNTTR